MHHLFLVSGIDAIKEALLEGEANGHPDAPVRIKLIAPPMYVISCMTLDKDMGLDSINRAIEAIAVSIRNKG